MAKAIKREAAAAELDCSTRTIDRLIVAGELEAFKLSATEGGGVRVTVSSIDGLIERRLNAAKRRGHDGSARPAATRVDVANVRASLRKARRERAAERRG
jgi:hypothetical protein